MTKAILITIGDEILSGSTLDTNAHFIAKEFKNVGIKVIQKYTISDDIAAITQTLSLTKGVADVVIMTGGIGPTKDDKTKDALAEYFKDTLIFDEDTYQHLAKILEKRNRLEILETNREQAVVLSKAKILQNDYGTAPCHMIEEDGQLFFSLPGVPYEVKPLLREKILPLIMERYGRHFIVTRTVSVVGIPESVLADTIADWENKLPSTIHVSYLPIANRIKLQLSIEGEDKDQMELILSDVIGQLKPLIGNYMIGTSEEQIENLVRDVLIAKKLTISCAESCTGGAIARLLTDISGSSAYFRGGVVTYATDTKVNLLNVSQDTIDTHTVVSEQVASEMSSGCQRVFASDIAIATTGVAGPNKGEDGKDVGLVYFSIRYRDVHKTFSLFLPHLDRSDFMNFVAMKALQEVVLLLTVDAR